MGRYIIKRLLLVIPTLLGIMLVIYLLQQVAMRGAG
jgi:ABC-type microcin C transport system permease subunit YejB